MGSRFVTTPKCNFGHTTKRRTISILFPEFSLQKGSKNLKRSSTIAFSYNSRVFSPNTNSINSLQVGLLMENLHAIEDILGDNNLIKLEKDILAQIKHLGALNLFHECLKRNLESNWSPIEKKRSEVIIRTGKIRERKLRREKASEKRANEMANLKLPRKNDKVKKYNISFGWRSKKDLDGRNESELANGFKSAIELERIREKIENETGRPVSNRNWAKAAKIDTKTLINKLIFGLYCQDELIRSTRPLVLLLAKKFKGMGIASEDLVQAGSIAVLRGAERFDIKRGYKFSTYVRHWIKKAFFEVIAKNSRIFHLSVRTEGMVQKVEKAKRELHFNLGRFPKDEELAKFTDLPLDKIRLVTRCSRSVISLNQCIMHGSRITLEDIIPDTSVQVTNDLINNNELREGLLCILEKLNPREKKIIALRYGLEDGYCKSLEEIGRQFNVTKEWIRILEKNAINKLRRDDIQREVRSLFNW